MATAPTADLAPLGAHHHPVKNRARLMARRARVDAALAMVDLDRRLRPVGDVPVPGHGRGRRPYSRLPRQWSSVPRWLLSPTAPPGRTATMWQRCQSTRSPAVTP